MIEQHHISQTESGLSVFRKTLPFRSHTRTHITPLTKHINEVIAEFHQRADVRQKKGIAHVRIKHTTCRLVDCEIGEPKLLRDMLRTSLEMFPEDKRGTWVTEQKYGCFTTGEDGWYRFPTTEHVGFQYEHDCMDNIKRPPDEIDEDFNAARHLRASAFGHHLLSYSYNEKGLEPTAYSEPSMWEFDGRDGKGRNPERIRRVTVMLMPFDVYDADNEVAYNEESEIPLIY